MFFEMLFSIALLLFSGYAYWYVGATCPPPTETELGATFWPRMVLVIMAVLTVINIINILKKTRATGASLAPDGEAVKEFFKNKIFIGMIMVVIMAFVLNYAGFILTTFVFIMAYGRLLGQKSPAKLLLSGLIATVVLYIIFQGALDIMLPRGYGFLRNFALMMESLLPF